MATIKTINGKSFQIYPVDLLKKLHLDRQLIKIIAPAFKGIGGKLEGMKNLKDFGSLNIDFAALMDGIVEGMGALDEEEYEKFINTLLAKVVVQLPGKAPQDFATTPGLMEECFSEDLPGFYELLFAVLQENKLTPFELVARGLGMKKTNSSGLKQEEESKPGNE